MGFSIDYGGSGILGAIIAIFLVAAGGIILFALLSAAKKAREDMIEEEGEDSDLIA